MGKFFKIGTGIGVGIAVAVVALVVFTNVDDMVSEQFGEMVAEVKITNPLQTYSINTEGELFCHLRQGSLYAILGSLSFEELEQKYPSEFKTLKEFAEKNPTASSSKTIPPEVEDFMVNIMMKEMSIHPKLEPNLRFFAFETSNLSALQHQRLIEKYDCMNVFYPQITSDSSRHLISSGSMVPTLNVYDVVVIDEKTKFEDLLIGDIIVFNRPSGHDKVIIHRVVFIIDDDPLTLRTKGDANPSSIPGSDFPISEEEYIGKVIRVEDLKGNTILNYEDIFIVPEDITKIPYPVKPVSEWKMNQHEHTSLLVKTSGDKFDFRLTPYQIKSQYIHFEGVDGDTIHRHASGVPLNFLFDSIGFSLSDECLTIDDGRTLCTDKNNSLKFFINHEQVQSIENYVIREGDRILISYGDESPSEIENQLDELESQFIAG